MTDPAPGGFRVPEHVAKQIDGWLVSGAEPVAAVYEIELRVRPWWKRAMRLPVQFWKFYSILRKANGVWSSAKCAASMAASSVRIEARGRVKHD